MKIILWIITLATILLYIGELKVTFSPFSISLPAWRITVATIMLIVGLALYSSHYRIKGYRRALDAIIEYVDKKIEENEYTD